MIFQEFNLTGSYVSNRQCIDQALGYMNTFTSLFRMFSKKDVGRAIELIKKVGFRRLCK